MLTILYLLLSEEEENDRLLPVIAIVLYLVMK